MAVQRVRELSKPWAAMSETMAPHVARVVSDLVDNDNLDVGLGREVTIILSKLVAQAINVGWTTAMSSMVGEAPPITEKTT